MYRLPLDVNDSIIELFVAIISNKNNKWLMITSLVFFFFLFKVWNCLNTFVILERFSGHKWIEQILTMLI